MRSLSTPSCTPQTLAARQNRRSTLTKRKIDDGVLTDAEREELTAASKDFIATIGKNRPFDLIIVD